MIDYELLSGYLISFITYSFYSITKIQTNLVVEEVIWQNLHFTQHFILSILLSSSLYSQLDLKAYMKPYIATAHHPAFNCAMNRNIFSHFCERRVSNINDVLLLQFASITTRALLRCYLTNNYVLNQNFFFLFSKILKNIYFF